MDEKTRNCMISLTFLFRPVLIPGMVKDTIFFKKSIISDIINFEPDIFDINDIFDILKKRFVSKK